MNEEIVYKTGYNNHKFFFIRLKVKYLNASKSEIDELIISLHEKSNIMDEGSAWGRVLWVKGTSDFFGEVKNILQWMLDREDIFLEIGKKGRGVEMLIGLSGADFINSTLDSRDAFVMLRLGLKVIVEIFPHLEFLGVNG